MESLGSSIPIIVALISSGALVLIAKSQRKLSKETALIEAMHLDTIESRIEIRALKVDLRGVESDAVSLRKYVYELHDHINQKLPPPPPNFPESLLGR